MCEQCVQALQQEEILFKTRFRLLELERKIGRALGSRSEEKSDVLAETIKKLEAELEAARVEAGVLSENAQGVVEVLGRQFSSFPRMTYCTNLLAPPAPRLVWEELVAFSRGLQNCVSRG